MPDVGFDTSSYPRASLPVQQTPLQIAGQLGAIQQQKLSIDQAKLDQANQGFTYLTRAMSSLGPNATKDQYKEVGANAVKLGLVPANMLNVWDERVDAAPDSPTFFNQVTNAVNSHQQILQNYKGTPAGISDNAKIYQGVTGGLSSPAPGGFTSATEGNIQPPPTQPNVNNQPRLPTGQPNPAYMQPGIVGAPPPGIRPSLPVQPLQPGPVASPAIAGPSSNFGGRVVGANVEPPTNAATGTPIQSAAQPIVTGPPPNYNSGIALHNKEREVATAKATALKPLEEAYDLAKNVATGPGTESLNKARAYLHNLGIIKANEKDPAVIYPELNKNLAQFVDKNGSRSDADLAVKESGNANAKTQIQPALLHMVQKIIGRERMEIARPQAFEGADEQNYPDHATKFPTNQDERAYFLDKMPPAEASALYNDMRTKALAGDPEGIKFIKSLATAKKAGLVTGLSK